MRPLLSSLHPALSLLSLTWAWSEMPTVTVSPSSLAHSWVGAYFTLSATGESAEREVRGRVRESANRRRWWSSQKGSGKIYMGAPTPARPVMGTPPGLVPGTRSVLIPHAGEQQRARHVPRPLSPAVRLLLSPPREIDPFFFSFFPKKLTHKSTSTGSTRPGTRRPAPALSAPPAWTGRCGRRGRSRRGGGPWCLVGEEEGGGGKWRRRVGKKARVRGSGVFLSKTRCNSFRPSSPPPRSPCASPSPSPPRSLYGRPPWPPAPRPPTGPG